MIGGLYLGESYLGGMPSISGTYTPPIGPEEVKTFSKLMGFDRGKPTLSSIVSNKPIGSVS